jgi:hypothetical protein
MNQQRTQVKADRFGRLAERRVTEALRKLRLIGNLANRHNYAYSDEQVKQVLEALESELRHVKARFRQETSVQSQGFSFRKSGG